LFELAGVGLGGMVGVASLVGMLVSMSMSRSRSVLPLHWLLLRKEEEVMVVVVVVEK
jgi:hypothetical protein